MTKSSPIFVNLLFVFVVIIAGCSGKQMQKNPTPQQKPTKIKEISVIQDTVWREDVVNTFYYPTEFSWDTTIQIDNAAFTLHMQSQDLPDEYEAILSYEQGDTIIAQKHKGPNQLYSIELYDSLDKIVSEISWDKYELEAYISKDLLAGSRGDRWYFSGYQEPFEQFFLDVHWIIEDSDVGEEYRLFLNKDLTVGDYFLDTYTGGGGCHCEIEPSADGKTFAFCSRIYHSNGNHTDLNKKDVEITGSFVLNNEYSLVIEMFDGKPPYKNAKIYDRSGRVVKQFDYTGISGGLGYTIPKFQVDDQNALFLLDAPKRILFRIDLSNPMDIQTIDIDKLEKTGETVEFEKENPSFLEISSEVKSFYLCYKNGEFQYVDESPDY